MGDKEEERSSGSNRAGRDYANGAVATSNGSVKASSDLAVYEQFEQQVGRICLSSPFHCNFCLAFELRKFCWIANCSI